MVCNKSNRTDATCGAETTYHSWVSEFAPGFYRGSCCSIVSFLCSALYIIGYPYVLLPLWSLCGLFSYIWLLITPLVSSNFSFDHCVVCPPIYGFWLPLWYLLTFLLTIVLSVLLYTLLVIPLVSSNFSFARVPFQS